MDDQPGSDAPDPERLSEVITEIAGRSQRLVTEFLARQAADAGFRVVNPLNIGGAFMEMTARMMADPASMMQAQMTLWQDYMALWENTTRRPGESHLKNG